MAEDRRRYVIGAKKIRKELRDVSGPVLRRAEARYGDIMQSDDDPEVPEGAHTAFVAYLTEEEAEAFRAASNARYVQLDGVASPAPVFREGDRHTQLSDGTALRNDAGHVQLPGGGAFGSVAGSSVQLDEAMPSTMVIPPVSTLAWMGASLAEQGAFNGDAVKVAVLDGGTSPEVRAQCPWTMIARRYYNTQPGDVATGPDEIVGHHGCLVTPEAVPPGGELIEAMIAYDEAGNARFSDAAAAMIWAADLGAQVINYSFSAGPTVVSQPMQDAIIYLRDRGIQFTVAAGNDNLPDLNYPSNQSRFFDNVHSLGAFVESTDARASFSNYHWDLSGVLPGSGCLSLAPDGSPVAWSGTSSAAPKAALLIAMASTGGTYTPQEAAFALRASARDTGSGRDHQGAGAWNLANALDLLDLASQPSPENHMQLAQTSIQAIANNFETRMRFHTIRESGTIVTPNTNRDIFTVAQAGLYLITASCRWVGFNNTVGDKIIMLGNNVGWTTSTSKRWKTDSRGGTVTPMGQTIAHVQRFVVGDQFCVWVNQGSGITWNLEPTIGTPAADPATLTITRLAA